MMAGHLKAAPYLKDLLSRYFYGNICACFKFQVDAVDLLYLNHGDTGTLRFHKVLSFLFIV